MKFLSNTEAELKKALLIKKVFRPTKNMPYLYVTLHQVYIFLTSKVTNLVYTE